LSGDRSSASSTSDTLEVCETFVSLCGETLWQGLPAFFVRVGGCNLRCKWCDTAYAWQPGKAQSTDSLLEEALRTRLALAVITGGEPLLQSGSLTLASALAAQGWIVLIETNGTLPIVEIDERVSYIVDVKPPSAAASVPFLTANLERLRSVDELKFVVTDRADFDHAVRFVEDHALVGRCGLLISPAHGSIEPSLVADWIIALGAPLRLQLQLHKILWGPDARGR